MRGKERLEPLVIRSPSRDGRKAVVLHQYWDCLILAVPAAGIRPGTLSALHH
jgi:hypothetical protein